jgi:UDP:flavonoid glycosyltransferase YjiC (YdhE family)
VRDAVHALLHTPGYRARARELAREYAEHDAITRAVDHVETLIGSDDRVPLVAVGG